VLSFEATSDRQYVVYANLGEQHRGAYQLLCNLQTSQVVEPSIVPDLCNQILCGYDMYTPSALEQVYPGIGGEMSPYPVGGFLGAGSICDQCIGGGSDSFLYPVLDCLIPVTFAEGVEEIVYVNTKTPLDEAWGTRQIHKMNADGTNDINLSNNDFQNWFPDVRPDGQKIVFNSFRPNEPNELFIMDIDGGNEVAIEDTNGAYNAQWGRIAQNHWLVFVQGESIWHIKTDGSDKFKITEPDHGEYDTHATVYQSKEIVFSREKLSGQSELYIQSIRPNADNTPAIRLTETTDQLEVAPIISHDHSMVAYRVIVSGDNIDNIEDVIRIATFDAAAENLNVIQEIDLTWPATRGIIGHDFSADDEWLYISIRVNDVEGDFVNRYWEIFKVKIDGTNQSRITVNIDTDVSPNTVPR